MQRRIIVFLLLLCCCMFITGCWDKIEIEDRQMILGIGVDVVKPEKKPNPQDKYVFSFASPIPAAVKDGQGVPFNTFKTINDTMTVSLAQLLERFAKRPFFEHTRLVVIGEEVFKDEKLFKPVLDALSRFHGFHESMLVFIVPGRAEEVFKVKPKFDKLLTPYITGIAENSTYNTYISELSMGDLIKNMVNQNGNSVIPRMTPFKDEVKVSGMGIVKNYKLIGYLTEPEGMQYNWIAGKAKAGVIEIEAEGMDTAYRHNSLDRNIKLTKVEGGKVYLTYRIVTEGSVEEYEFGKKMSDQDVVTKMQDDVASYITNKSEKLIAKFQKELKVDLIGAGDYLSKYHPKLYKSLGTDTEAIFTDDIVIKVEADVKIRRVGLTK